MKNLVSVVVLFFAIMSAQGEVNIKLSDKSPVKFVPGDSVTIAIFDVSDSTGSIITGVEFFALYSIEITRGMRLFARYYTPQNNSGWARIGGVGKRTNNGQGMKFENFQLGLSAPAELMIVKSLDGGREYNGITLGNIFLKDSSIVTLSISSNQLTQVKPVKVSAILDTLSKNTTIKVLTSDSVWVSNIEGYYEGCKDIALLYGGFRFEKESTTADGSFIFSPNVFCLPNVAGKYEITGEVTNGSTAKIVITTIIWWGLNGDRHVENINLVQKLNFQPATGIEIPSTEVSIYPNPFKEKVNIKFSDWKNHAVSIYDLTGKKVREVHGQDQVSIEKQNLKSGIYFAIIDGDKKTARKIIAR